jgi:hypothetical protein
MQNALRLLAQGGGGVVQNSAALGHDLGLQIKLIDDGPSRNNRLLSG